LELRKISDWAQKNRLTFNENKSIAMLMSRRNRREKKEVEIYLNYKILEQVNKIKYLGIIFDSKLLSREHINYIGEKCVKLIFALSRSAKVTWGFGHESHLNHTHRRNLAPDVIWSPSVEKCAK